MDDQLMLGILLIIVGLAVGLIAVALVLNRREERLARLEDENEEPEELEEAEESPDIDDEEQAPGSDEVDDEEASEDEGEDPLDDEQATEAVTDAPRERNLVAEVYREEVTGRLIVKTGDKEYSEGKQIEDETERRRLAYAASDLSDWFQGEFDMGGRPASPSAPQPASTDQMLEEINEILQRSLAGTPERAVRLFPDTAGGVKVLIGVKSYEIEDVPDDEIRDLIRQAVAEWEARQ